MFGNEITYIGVTTFQPEEHYVLARDQLKKKGLTSDTLNNQMQLSIPLGYRIVSADQNAILYVNTEEVKAKVYQKKDRKFSPEFGIPTNHR